MSDVHLMLIRCYSQETLNLMRWFVDKLHMKVIASMIEQPIMLDEA
jgi:hypothetical protein